ncbi:polysaccharide deacetylase family protein [Arthrobacter crystallopoietes]|uniref:Polysaccharide deacetylase n=1 Tax=Crystallibacter crystallopoietes TaxID=37928 RepID=A0A1H0XK27_9MICC|nr:polysaccharide deacetylase family protein [Arthrobacter crystallopoietes]SDQ03223.1 Polysaccharide deacetylase [Arthrobacter crystallopoietes]
MKNGAGSGDAQQKPKRSLQWITALLLLALPAAFLIFGGRLLATEASTTAPGGRAGSPPADAPSGVEAAPGNRAGAAIDVPDYVPAEPMPVVDGQTVVSVAFDDGFAGQRRAAQVMSDAGLDGTFYVNSGYLDKPGYLTLKQVKDIALQGHEIGGHSLSHPDLQALSVDEAARQICIDRRNLVDWGFSVTNFSYPFASHNQQVEAKARECGYNSARSLGDVRTRFGCEECPPAESLRPEIPYRLKAPAQVESDWTLRDLQDTVTAAETSGGWVILTFHGLCPDKCTEIGVSEDIFTQFTAWLAERNSRGRTVVRTVQQVIGGPKGEPAGWPAAEPAAAGSNGVKNPGLERRADGGPPVCWMEGGYGRNIAQFSEAPGRDGSSASKLTVQEYVDGDAKLLPQQDLGECAPQVIPDRSYSLRVWYQSDAVTQFSVYYRDGTGSWRYWTASPYFPASQEVFAQAEWTTPPVPDDANALSFGLALFSNGELITDDYELYDAAGAPPLKAK